MRRVAFVVTVLVAGLSSTTRPQEGPQPDVEWHEAWYLKFKPGGFYEGEGLLRDHFLPVEQAIGRRTIIFEYRTGQWDFVIYFPMDGPGDLEQRTSPMWEQWSAAFVELEGEEGAAEIQSRLEELIARTETQLAERWLYDGGL